MKDKNFKTSAVYILEIAHHDLDRASRHPEIDDLQPGPPHTAAVPSHRHTSDGKIPHAQYRSHGSSGEWRGSENSEGVIHRSSKALKFLHDETDAGKNYAHELRRASSVVIALSQKGPARTAWRGARIFLWHAEKHLGHYSEALNGAQKLVDTFGPAVPKINAVLHSKAPWGEKGELIGAEVAAASIRGALLIELGAAHEGIAKAREAAAFAGVNVANVRRTFETFSPLEIRSYMNSRNIVSIINYFDLTIDHQVETVVTGDRLYAIIDTHVQRPLTRKWDTVGRRL